ncbi:MAG: hypothetical protein IPM24_11225 [Bryobacterales bacterium]|nr:hypothetical protein [Bryobacterales bacterium]
MSGTDPNAAGRGEVREYAGGWMTERKGTGAPGFLKLAFPIIGLFCAGYLVVYMYGEVDHADRGALVRTFNEMTVTSPGLMYGIAAMALLYVVLVTVFVIGRSHEDE